MLPFLAVEGGLTLQVITHYLFWVGCVGMGAGTVFFLAERNSVPKRLRSTMTVAAIVTGIACFHYYRMASVYEAGAFPTEYRYIDWLLTTPLLLIKFPLLLGLTKAAGRKLMVPLIVLDVLMIVTAFIAETSPLGGPMWWSFFIIACLFEAGIVGVLYFAMTDAISDAPTPIADSIRTMRLFILFGWAIYPIGFLLALSGGGEIREIIYNVGDLVNKVGFGLVAYAGLKAMAAVEESSGLPNEPSPASA